MSIKISYKNSISEKLIKNYVLFANEEFKSNGLSKLSLSKQSNQINRTINSNKSKKKKFIVFNYSPDQKIIDITIKIQPRMRKKEQIFMILLNLIC